MNAYDVAKRLLQQRPQDADTSRLARFLLALESEQACALNELYEMRLKNFELALEILREWRLARYYSGKAKVFHVPSARRSGHEREE